MVSIDSNSNEEAILRCGLELGNWGEYILSPAIRIDVTKASGRVVLV